MVEMMSSKKKQQTAMHRSVLVVLVVLVVLAANLVSACVYNSECAKNSRCLGGVCVVEECRTTPDCLSKGLYFKCANNRCVASKHKICRTNDDCKKNVLNKKCVQYNCA